MFDAQTGKRVAQAPAAAKYRPKFDPQTGAPFGDDVDQEEATELISMAGAGASPHYGSDPGAPGWVQSSSDQTDCCVRCAECVSCKGP